MEPASEQAETGTSPAQVAGSASTPDETAPAGDAANVADVPTDVAAGSDPDAAAVPTLDPVAMAATVERGTGGIQYEIDGVPVPHHEYAEWRRQQDKAAALAELQAAAAEVHPYHYGSADDDESQQPITDEGSQ
jgi:hypothetical protein